MSPVKLNYKKLTLPNGLVVGICKTNTGTFTGELEFYHGAINEQPHEAGLAHFLEHVVMNGGSDNSPPRKVEELRSSWGNSNAGTSISRTQYTIDSLTQDLPSWLGFVSDVVFNPKLGQAVLEQERQRVLREVTQYVSSPSYADSVAAREALFGLDHPLTTNVLGNPDIINSATRDHLLAFHARGYSPNNAHLILVGGLPYDVEKQIENHFGSIERGPGSRIKFPANSPPPRTILHRKAPELYASHNPHQNNAELSISFYAPPLGSEDQAAFDLATNILCGGVSSRVHLALSNQSGLTYGFGGSYSLTEGVGTAFMGGQVQATRIDKAVEIIFDEIEKLKDTKISQRELDHLKKRTLYKMNKAYESNTSQLDVLKHELTTGQIYTQVIDNVMAVTIDDVQKAAQKYFPKQDGNYVMLIRDPLLK